MSFVLNLYGVSGFPLVETVAAWEWEARRSYRVTEATKVLQIRNFAYGTCVSN